jgi:hypothetical protein
MKLKSNVYFFLLVLGLLGGCSSSSKKEGKKLQEVVHSTIKRDFEVRDASSNTRPGWIEDAEVWASSNDNQAKSFRYFSYETEPKVNRNMACSLAKANAKADIAGEIATFIDKSIASSVEGKASIDENNPSIQSLREFVSNNLTQKTQSLIHGAAIVKTYWEKRKYLKEKGAKRDFTAFTCAVFVRMKRERLETAVEKAANFVVQKTDDPETKENVKKALKDAATNFVKARRGEL